MSGNARLRTERYRPAVYRTGITAADVLVPSTNVAGSIIAAGGGLGIGNHYVTVVAGNAYGRTAAGTVSTWPIVVNDSTIRKTMPQIAGATYYDIYCGTNTTALPWVGRVTEAQRAAGYYLDIGTGGSGSVPDSVDLHYNGGGQLAGVTSVTNTAYVMPAETALTANGLQYMEFDVSMTVSGDNSAPELVLVPFYKNETDELYYQGEPFQVEFGGYLYRYGSQKQRIRIECRGSNNLHLLVAGIAGDDASVDIHCAAS